MAEEIVKWNIMDINDNGQHDAMMRTTLKIEDDIAIEHAGTVYSNDSDFGRFEGLRWRNPLQ